MKTTLTRDERHALKVIAWVTFATIVVGELTLAVAVGFAGYTPW